MKHILKLFLPLLLPILLLGQFENPVSITASLDHIPRAGEVVHVTVTASMDHEWHIYSVHDTVDGPLPTEISVSGSAIEEVGRVIEPKPISKFDDGFGMVTYSHAGTTEFLVPVKLKESIGSSETTLTVGFFYQTCNNALCYPPREVEIPILTIIKAGEPREEYLAFTKESSESSELTGDDELDAAIKAGIFPFILLSLSMGFLALLTPCVFPMIPITVSFFTHQGEVGGANPIKQATVYALGIISTFSVLGLLLAGFLGASGANQLAANPWVNIFIGSLFVYFALSLFGMYEIQVPQKLRQFTLKGESKGGYLGVLFMALTFTLTSFTCTVQFVGLLLVAAANGQWFWPALGMLTFSAAFALPFFFLALFPQYLAKMPKSGGWLNSVKVVMGFLELAAAFKFFSNTDLVWGWNILTHTSVLATWTVIMLFTGIYLLGKLRLPHDSPTDIIGVPRMLLSLFFITFSIYMGTGLFGQPIHGLIKSYLPPKLAITSIDTNGGSVTTHEVETHHWYNNLEDAFVEANTTGKNLFIDFTGLTCTNCRWMESNVFTKNEVKSRFDQFVLVQLYTDGGENYREKQQYEIDRFGTAALPYYVILTPEDDVVAKFPGLTRDLKKFIQFLDKGLKG
ncbi:MAG: thioredoxin family protein [Candidatus Marinimicrobia bacterium]|nr:thioredoxin family protein [Candidatus Neomarinimicrobiota bacterium]